jgi:hypothetical protein
VAQSKTVSEVAEMRNQHNQARRKLERLEEELNKVCITTKCDGAYHSPDMEVYVAVESGTRVDGGRVQVEAYEGISGDGAAGKGDGGEKRGSWSVLEKGLIGLVSGDSLQRSIASVRRVVVRSKSLRTTFTGWSRSLTS